MMTKILCGNFEKSFLKCEKMAWRKVFQHLLHANVFLFIFLISNHMVFLIQFGINLHLWVFQKAEIALAEAAHAISTFWKTHSCKLIPNWTRNRMITYTNYIYVYCWFKDQKKKKINIAWLICTCKYALNCMGLLQTLQSTLHSYSLVQKLWKIKLLSWS